MIRTKTFTLIFTFLLMVGCGTAQIETEPPPDFAPESDTAIVPEQPPVEEILEDVQNGSEGEAVESQPIPTEPDEFLSPFADPFETAIFKLETPLPSDLHSAAVYVALTDETPAIAELEATSSLLGFDGRVYERYEVVYDVDPETGEEFVVEFPQEFSRFYSAFGNDLRADFFGTGFSYYDTEVFGTFSDQPEFMPYEEAKPLVEELLLDLGLIYFDYFIEEGFGSEVVINRIWPDIGTERTVVNALMLASGDLASLNYTYSPHWELVTELPQVTADVAWLQLLDEPGRFEYIHRPEVQTFAPTGDETERWVRQREAGEVFNTIISPEIYNVAGSNEMVLVADGTVLEAAPSLMAEIAESGTVENGIRVSAETRDSRGANLRILSWEPIDFVPSAYVEGTTAREGDLFKIIALNGSEYYLEAVPDDVPNDIEVFADGTEITQENGRFVLDWTVMYEQIDLDQFAENEVVEPVAPATFETITIQEVLPTYHSYFGPLDDSLNNVPLGVYREPHIPMWVFSGVTQEGDPIEFYVPAIILPDN